MPQQKGFQEPNYPPGRTHWIVSTRQVYTTVIAVCGVIQPTKTVLGLRDSNLASILKFGGNGKSRTFTAHRMKVLHYHYATLPYVNTLDIGDYSLTDEPEFSQICLHVVGAQGLEP